ncbi:MAG: metallophosphoesterase [Nibricoccus sp.]
MRLRLLSDLHLEFGSYEPPSATADVVVLAGDINVRERAADWILRNFPDPAIPVLYILGNHEFYGERIPRLTEKLRDYYSRTHVRLLENASIDLGAYRFFGATLWTDMALHGDVTAGYAAALEMNDFKRIRTAPLWKKFKPADARALHAGSILQLRRFLSAGASNAVVITHHAPSVRSLPPEVRDDPVSCGYVSDLEALIAEFQPLLWIHGHIHESSRYQIGRTTVLANPRGYPDSLNPAFQEDLVVSLDELSSAPPA